MTISDAELDEQLRRISMEMQLLEAFLQAFAGALGAPLLLGGQQSPGFRFPSPDLRHFCLLKAVRAVSAMNAAVLLARGGFTQEIVVLLRTIVECVTHIEYVLFSIGDDGQLSESAEAYVRKYFADSVRDRVSDYRGAKLRQDKVHKLVGSKLDDASGARTLLDEAGRTDAAELMSNMYLNFSNYVHARYPEVMDMYGGLPGRFHLQGMRHTPKDAENLQMLDAYETTVSQTVAHIALRLGIGPSIRSDPRLRSWLARHSGG